MQAVKLSTVCAGLAALFAAYAVLLVLPGGLFLTTHDGDTLHMIAIVERMAQGQVPHRDFMTPIGALAFFPIAVLVRLGLDAGMAFAVAQAVVGGVMTALAVYVARRRMPAWAVGVFGALVLILCVALVHGGADIAVSVSMHYNRWAWALVFVALVAAALPGEGRADGVVVGLCMAALVMTKVTFFVAAAPVVILAALLTGQTRMMMLAIGTGLVVAVALTVILGPDYWTAYAGDLLTVAGSQIRPQPGLGLSQLILSPAYIAGTLLAVVGGFVLRAAGQQSAALILWGVAASGIYITYQNFGNDPKWLALMALLLALFALPLAGRTRGAALAIAFGSAILALPSFLNMAVSPLRHAAIPQADYTPLLAGTDWHQDVQFSRLKSNRVRGDVALVDGVRGFDAPATMPGPGTFRGEPLRDCRSGPKSAYFASITADLKDRGLGQGQSIFALDIFSPYWLYGAHPPLRGGAPWYYDGLSGYADADLVLVPTCPTVVTMRRILAQDLDDAALTEIVRTPLYTLYEKAG